MSSELWVTSVNFWVEPEITSGKPELHVSDLLWYNKYTFLKFEYSYFNIQGTKAPALIIAGLNLYDYNTSDPLDYEKATSRATKMLLFTVSTAFVQKSYFCIALCYNKATLYE